MPLTNAEIGELLWRESEGAEGHRRLALRRAARGALHVWPEEAAAAAARGDPFTSLAFVGPRIAERIERWLATAPEVPEPPPARRGFQTRAEARAILAREPSWALRYRGDLQVHTTFSDGRASLRAMTEAAAARGYEYVAITDHSKGLAIAHGKDEAAFAEQAAEIAHRNDELAAEGSGLRVLRGIEMNVRQDGSGDMDSAFLRTLDVVLGAFHSNLRDKTDQTARYLAALENPDVDVLAHPRTRNLDRREGLQARWREVAECAAEHDKALEIDASPDRQDLDVETLALVRGSGCRIAIDTDAHSEMELAFVDFGLAAALAAGIAPERVVNFLPLAELLAWTASLRRQAA